MLSYKTYNFVTLRHPKGFSEQEKYYILVVDLDLAALKLNEGNEYSFLFRRQISK